MKKEQSAGGIVFKTHLEGGRKDSFKVEVLVCQHSGHHGWVFPKGFIGDKIAGESKEATALREVEEETGIIGKIIEPVTPITYWYEMDGEKHQKTVYYFLMEALGGDIKKHDWEMENVEWLPIDEVEGRLTYESDKTVFMGARKIIKQLATRQ